MITQNTKEYIIENLKWPANTLNYLLKYIFLLMPIFIIYIAIIEYSKGNSFFSFLLLGIIILLLLVYRIEYERKFVEMILTNNMSTNEISKKLSVNNFIVVTEYDGVLQMRSPKAFLSWGEEITIIKLPNKILINSQPFGTFPISLKNKINYDIIKKILEK